MPLLKSSLFGSFWIATTQPPWEARAAHRCNPERDGWMDVDADPVFLVGRRQYWACPGIDTS